MWCSTLRCIVMLILSLLAAPLAAEAQQATQVHRIGFLHPGLSLPEPPNLEALRQGLREMGYVEGQNLVIASRYAEGREERLPDLAAELARLKVDVIVAGGGAVVIRAAQGATRTIPIVMAGTSDPVAEGLVASLARPGGNITGLSYLTAEIPGKRLELLKEAVPQSTRIAVLVNPASALYEPAMHNLTVAAQALGLQLHVVEVRRAEELDTAFTAMTQEHADALLVVADAALLSSSRRGRLADLAATSRLPAMYSWKFFVEAGGLMSYGPSILDIYRRAATYVDKILKGAKPADLPVEQPTTFELVINLKTAKALGITIPPTLLFRADEVLQ
jgi:putative tryptophan/tyrosine transport system substrate-binding protein